MAAASPDSPAPGSTLRTAGMWLRLLRSWAGRAPITSILAMPVSRARLAGELVDFYGQAFPATRSSLSPGRYPALQLRVWQYRERSCCASEEVEESPSGIW